VSDEKHTQQDEEQQDDLDVTDEADDVKGGSISGRFGHDKGPDLSKWSGTDKGPDTSRFS
jgi:hypothetical protein